MGERVPILINIGISLGGVEVEKTELRPYQIQAIKEILKSVQFDSKRILVNMPVGTGKSIVILDVVKHIIEDYQSEKVMVLTSRNEQKDSLNRLFLSCDIQVNVDKMDDVPITITTYNWLRTHKEIFTHENYKYIVFYNAEESNLSGIKFEESNATLIGITDRHLKKNKFFTDDDYVFSYPVEDAVRDGYLSPLLTPNTYGAAVEGYCRRLLEQFGCESETSYNFILKKEEVDFCFCKDDQRILVECKSYRNRYVPSQTIDTAISQLAKKYCRYGRVDTDIILLIVFGEVSNMSKEEAFQKGIIVWDIANLIFYTQNNVQLLNELTRLAYFPIEGIKGQRSPEWKFEVQKTPKKDANIVIDRSVEFKKQLHDCGTGQESFSEYEKIGQDIIEYLFGEAFSSMVSQHKTKDEYFRMDLICTLKGEFEGIKSFWKMIAHYYNSHFVVFEFKNCENFLQQNLIYTTEKYLFNAALRNVAIIVSRKGFSKGAYFAACGCLKESGKLIIDISDEDLINMLDAKANGSEPTDYLVKKLEDLLMSISK